MKNIKKPYKYNLYPEQINIGLHIALGLLHFQQEIEEIDFFKAKLTRKNFVKSIKIII